MGTFFDLALLVILLIFVLSGLRRGFVRSLLELVGCIAALALTVKYAGQLAEAARPLLEKWLPSLAGNSTLMRVLAAAALFVALELAADLIISAVDHLFRLPVLRQINALLGGVFGFLKGVAVLLFLCAAVRFFVPSAPVKNPVWQQIGGSRIFQYADEKNPVYTFLQADIWNGGVDGDAKQKQEL